MRPKILIPTMIVLLAALTALFWRQPTPKAVSSDTVQQSVQSSNMPVAVKDVVGIMTSTNSQNDSNASPKEISLAEAQTNASAELKRASEQISPPVNFYGRVVDQDTNSLSGVRMKVNVLHWEFSALGMMPTSRAIIIEKATDTDGRFDIHGVTGSGFDIENMGKEGYELEPGQSTFGAVGGSIENPIIFKMWSTNIHEPLITGGNKFQIVTDGRPYFIDLTKGTISESGEGDLKVWIQYTNQPVRGQFSDWAAEIDVVTGGLQETKDYSMFTAPTEGYVPSFFWKNQIKGGQRGNIGERRFYLKLKNGQEYGRMVIELHAPFNNQIPGLIRLSYAINPSGSRILR